MKSSGNDGQNNNWNKDASDFSFVFLGISKRSRQHLLDGCIDLQIEKLCPENVWENNMVCVHNLLVS